MADGSAVEDIKVWNGFKWVSRSAQIYNSQWINLFRPKENFMDDFTNSTGTILQIAKALTTKAVSAGSTLLPISNTMYIQTGQALNISDGTNNEEVILLNRNLLRNSSVEKTSKNEFMQYADISPIIDLYGLVPLTISFDIKTPVPGSIQVYCQNGSSSEYSIGAIPVNVRGEYTRHSIVVVPRNQDSTQVQSQLAFYGSYGTGRIPTVKNVKIELGTKVTKYSIAPEDMYGTAENILSIEPLRNNYQQNSIVARTTALIEDGLYFDTNKTFTVESI